MFYYIILLPLIFFVTIYVFKKKKRTTNYRFVGQRCTGKTATINSLLNLDYKTVPTLETYTVKYRGMEITEVIEKDGNFCERYGIDSLAHAYVFFLRDPWDIDEIPPLKMFDMRYVYYGDKPDAFKRKDVLFMGCKPKMIKEVMF